MDLFTFMKPNLGRPIDIFETMQRTTKTHEHQQTSTRHRRLGGERRKRKRTQLALAYFELL